LERIIRNSLLIVINLLFIVSGYSNFEYTLKSVDNRYEVNKFLFPPDSTNTGDTTRQNIYPLENEGFPYTGDENNNPLYLKLPESIQSDVEYDPETGLYKLNHKMGDTEYRPPTYMTLDEYREYDLKNSVDDYWRERSKAAGVGTRSGIIPSIYIGGKAFDRIFGGNTIDIRPSGSVELIFGVLGNSRDDPTLDVKQRRQVNFDFQEKIQMNVIAKIGDKIEFKTNYNTEATFDFENKLNLRYEGEEDEIIQLIEAGDVSLPLNSSLITGSQSLFGIKSKLRFGKTTVTAIYSEQESETSNITVQGGAQTNEFLLKTDDYEENKHFFLAHFFREQYADALRDLPIVSSGINITKIEVWVTNIGPAVNENRNIVAFTDLGENDRIYSNIIDPNYTNNARFPDNYSNTLFESIDSSQIRNIDNVNNHLLSAGYVSGEDFEKVELARKLSNNEYTFNSKLGFISLNTTLNSDQTLAVAYQYQIIGQDSSYFQVGEFSDEGITGQNTLITKLLKSTYVNIKSPMWDLMMKNVYSLNAYQVNGQDFVLNILYSGDESGVPTGYFNEGDSLKIKGVPLIEIFNLDNLDAQNNPPGDGVFDFIDNAATNGGTINSSNGRVFFPVVEPFSSTYLKDRFDDEWDYLAEKWGYDSLYTLTKTGAQQYAEKNKYLISGYYKSQSGSEISLNALNVPPGSVTVTAGGVPLVENVDYTVDYTLGRVRIINEGILNSGTPINISMESNTLFSIQTKRLMGAHIDYDVSRDFHLGGTILNLHERPLTQKVNYGDDPISNTIWGVDYSYQTKSRFITKLIDKLPFISTSAESNVSIDGEFAHFIPGHSRAVGKEGVSYIDDFEGTKSTIDMRNFGNWFLASTPQFQSDIFPEAEYMDVSYGYNRAKTAWYTIDPTVFYDRNSTLRPENVDNEELSDNFVRQILETEVFPNKDIPNGTPTNISVLNVSYFPEERGPYNFDAAPTEVSAGLNPDGTLADPSSRWGGMMRKIETSDFESANIEYIEFWVMDPFAESANYKNNSGGELYFNLGDISEDILKDSRKGYEHGLPIVANPTADDIDTTIWGRVPDKLDLVQSFSNEAGAREFQDVGYDGLSDTDEASFFSSASQSDKSHPYIDIVQTNFPNSQALQNAVDDPSGDNYRNYRGDELDGNNLYSRVIERYKGFNGPDGNSPENTTGGVYDGNTRQPNVEDLNEDNTLSESERYFQYKVQLRPDKMKVGENYITDVHEAVGIPLVNGQIGSVKWYQFKIPVRDPDKVVGNINDFKSIRFMRMFFKEFDEPVTLRFATLDLVRGEWRRYPSNEDLFAPGEYIPSEIDMNAKKFDLSAVNIEENGRRTPIPYIIPPGIEQEINVGTTNLTRLNEQSMVMNICELADGDMAAAYKTADFDFRQFKRLKMFVHAEKSIENDDLKTGELTVFMRLGSDFTQNYYEYEIPLKFTPWYSQDGDEIWPEGNEFDIDLDRLAHFKLERNTKMREPGSTVGLNFAYVAYDGENKVTVLGSPSISDVKSIMIGVRNPKKTEAYPDDDGEPKCAEIWVNELRLSDFNKQSGWAATNRISMNLADLGNLTLSGMYSSPWFASIDKKITEIQLDATTQFDIATNIELGKFFPEDAGVRIPMHYDYSETRIKPKYNPLDPDLILDEVIDSYDLEADKDQIKEATIDFTKRKNINFMNVRKDKVGAQTKSRVYDIENFDISYSYSEIYHRNVDIEHDKQQNYMGGLGYTYSNAPKNVKPFEKIGFIANTKALQLIKDFNFYFLPKMFSFRTDMNRMYSTRKLRNKSFGDVITRPTYNKTWDWNRMYDLKFDLASSLTFNYNANVGNYIYEYPGSNKELWRGTIDDETIIITPEEKQQQVKDEIFRGGSRNRFAQNASLNYNIPINKIPILDWVTGQTGYTVTYTWNATARSIQAELGNTIANNQNWNINGNADLEKLYNKVGFLKNINQPPRQKPARKPARPDPNDTTKVEKERPNYAKIAYTTVLKLLMSVKKVTFQYGINNGTNLPGFMPEPGMIGNSWGSTNAPGLPFIFGYQPDGPQYFNQDGWLSTSSRLNQSYGKMHNENMNIRATLEPFKGFKIEVTADRTFSNNIQSYFVFDTTSNNFVEGNRMQTGTFTMSFISWGTAFGGSLDNERSQNFENLKDYRLEVAQRLADEHPENLPTNDTTGFPLGYGSTSQYVLLPSFIAAYTGKSPGSVALTPFPKIPLPNWRFSYNGLSKVPFFKRFFKSFTINHAYRSAYSVGSFNSNIKFVGDTINGTIFPIAINEVDGNFFPEVEFAAITINEQFSPLLNFDMTMHNNLLAKLEYKKARSLSMSFANNQLTEVSSNEIVVGLGFRFKDVPLTFASPGGGGKRTTRSDLNLKADFSIRNNKTVLRSIDTDLNQISAGQKVVTIDTSADYDLSKSLTLRLFFSKIITNPFLPSQYRNSTTNGGISLRFSLAQ
jgi:cell surface protein SprA